MMVKLCTELSSWKIIQPTITSHKWW